MGGEGFPTYFHLPSIIGCSLELGCSLDLKVRVYGKDSFEEAVANYQLAYAMEQEKIAREEVGRHHIY
jgi:hypothetical protein